MRPAEPGGIGYIAATLRMIQITVWRGIWLKSLDTLSMFAAVLSGVGHGKLFLTPSATSTIST